VTHLLLDLITYFRFNLIEFNVKSSNAAKVRIFGLKYNKAMNY